MDFSNHRIVWQWEYSQQAEKTIEAVCQTIVNYAGADVLFAKVMDGPVWMGQFDPGSPNNLQEVQDQWQRAKDSGVIYIPWVVPTTANDAIIHRQLQQIGDGTLVLDVEEGAEFWQGGDFNGYLDQMLGYGPNDGSYHLWASVDVRNPVGDIYWYTRVRGILPQLYWTSFVQDPWACVGLLNGLIQELGGDSSAVIPTLPGDAVNQDLYLFWEVARWWKCAAPALWRLGEADVPTLRQFGALQLGT